MDKMTPSQRGFLGNVKQAFGHHEDEDVAPLTSEPCQSHGDVEQSAQETVSQRSTTNDGSKSPATQLTGEEEAEEAADKTYLDAAAIYSGAPSKLDNPDVTIDVSQVAVGELNTPSSLSDEATKAGETTGYNSSTGTDQQVVPESERSARHRKRGKKKKTKKPTPNLGTSICGLMSPKHYRQSSSSSESTTNGSNGAGTSQTRSNKKDPTSNKKNSPNRFEVLGDEDEPDPQIKKKAGME